jgi:hypothetical protein
MAVTLTGNDIITINDRILADFAEGDVAVLNFPLPLSTLKTGKNGNTLYALNEEGRQCELTLKLLKGSSDDRFLNALLNQMLNNGVAFTLLSGRIVKKLGDGAGNVCEEQYLLSGGIFKKSVGTVSSAAGSIEQAVALYTLHFSAAPRLFG